jgi:hypothetical protein
MQNVEKAASSIYLELGGVQRRFEFTMWSIAQMKRLSGKNALRGELDVQDPDDLAVLVWAGLIPSDPSLDGQVIPSAEPGKPGQGDDNVTAAIYQIQKWMRFDRLGEIGSAVRQAFDSATPAASKKK